VGHVASLEHEAVHSPSAQTGVDPEHWALVVQGAPTGVGSHTPFWQVDPDAHAPDEPQAGTHWLSAQTSPGAHWLVNWQAFDEAVQEPATQT
jgi:hypothetical protein